MRAGLQPRHSTTKRFPSAPSSASSATSDRRLARDVVKAGPPNGKKVAVVGSGPAGHSAAYQLARLGYAVTIFEKSPKAGGLNRGGIPDWVLPQDVLDREIERLVELGITIKTNTEVGKDVTWDDLEEELRRLRPGRRPHRAEQRARRGENKDGVLYGLPFLRDIGMGTSTVKLGRASPSSAAATPRSTARAKHCGRARRK